MCISFCADNGHAYAGTQYSEEVSKRRACLRHSLYVLTSTQGFVIENVACAHRPIYTPVMQRFPAWHMLLYFLPNIKSTMIACDYQMSRIQIRMLEELVRLHILAASQELIALPPPLRGDGLFAMLPSNSAGAATTSTFTANSPTAAAPTRAKAMMRKRVVDPTPLACTRRRVTNDRTNIIVRHRSFRGHARDKTDLYKGCS